VNDKVNVLLGSNAGRCKYGVGDGEEEFCGIGLELGVLI